MNIDIDISIKDQKAYIRCKWCIVLEDTTKRNKNEIWFSYDVLMTGVGSHKLLWFRKLFLS